MALWRENGPLFASFLIVNLWSLNEPSKVPRKEGLAHSETEHKLLANAERGKTNTGLLSRAPQLCRAWWWWVLISNYCQVKREASKLSTCDRGRGILTHVAPRSKTASLSLLQRSSYPSLSFTLKAVLNFSMLKTQALSILDAKKRCKQRTKSSKEFKEKIF